MKCTEAQHTSPGVARHVPTRPSGAEAIHRHSVIGSDREAAASYDDVGFKGAVRGGSQSSTPRVVGKAGSKREARHVDGDTGNRTIAVSKWMRLLAATFAAVLVIIFSIVEGEAVRKGIIRIYETAVAVEGAAQHTSPGVARHVPTRQDGAEAIHRHSVIGSDREAAASYDDVGFKGAVRGL